VLRAQRDGFCGSAATADGRRRKQMSRALTLAKLRLLKDREAVNTRIVEVARYCSAILNKKAVPDEEFPLKLALLEVAFLRDAIDPELERQIERIRT
jgi:hypothetical protein